MFLITGPPAAGKTSYCLAALRDCLLAKDSDCLLLVPTSTMAEHLRNELARERLVFSPRLISTLGRFVDQLAPGLTPAGAGTLELIVGEVLSSLDSGRYAGVREFVGFRSALARTVVEFAGAGGDLSHLSLTDSDFARVFERTLAELKRRSLHLRSQRLSWATSRIAEARLPSKIWVTGFSAFTPGEVELLKALAERASVTVTMTNSAVTPALLRSVKERREVPDRPSTAGRTLIVANTPDGEANEIARRMLAEVAKGRPWRHMAVVLRDAGTVPVVQAAFERFHVPARYYFAPPLSSSATVRYLLALVDSALSGWEHEASLDALRMHGSPLERGGDRWEYAVRTALPGRGLDGLRAHAPDWTHSFFEELDKLSAWADEQHSPKAWVTRFASLPALFRPLPIQDGTRPDLWREQAGTLDGFRAAVEEAGSSLPPVATNCREFVDALGTILHSTTVRAIDRRRDVVHVIDAAEARQWRVPVVFLAGLLEGRFPRHHSESPILPDDVRRRLREQGVQMKTAADRQADEQMLFELALTCATEHTYLSYPRLNGKGEANLPSFLLERARPYAEETAAGVRPQPLRARAPEPFAIIQTDELLRALAARHASLSPSGIETYANCPYSFFGTRTLRLATPPDGPYDRLNILVQGEMAHLAFELHFRDNTPIEQAFDEAFRDLCRRRQVPPGYRTEAVRLELLHGVHLLVRDARTRLREERSLFEEPFECDLGDGTLVKGRIDRIEIDRHGNALIFDYKYRRADKLKETVKDNVNGDRVQTGMYLLGARSLNLNPVGMAYCGFKKEVSVMGWVCTPHYPQLNAACSQEYLEEMIATARTAAIQAANDLRSGRIEANPADKDKCQYCDLVTICRQEVREAQQTAGGTGAA